MKKRERTDIMFISRGHGRGHAMPDMAMSRTLLNLRPKLIIRFVSYAAGAEAYRSCGYEVLDLEQPDKPALLEMVVVLTRLLAMEQPRLVVAHEEIGALTAAKVLGIPCVFITDFFNDPGNWSMWSLLDAGEIIFTAERGLFTEPPYLKEKVTYVGRAVRPLKYQRSDQMRARKELGISGDTLVALCQPGAWVESHMPLADLLGSAWNLVTRSCKHLIWLGGRDYALLSERLRGDGTITVLKEDWEIDRLMAASDVLITKANRMTVYEAAAMGLPSISISSMVNWPDDVAVAHVESNTWLFRESVSAETLARLIEEKCHCKVPPACEASQGVPEAADRILNYLDKVKGAETTDQTLIHACSKALKDD